MRGTGLSHCRMLFAVLIPIAALAVAWGLWPRPEPTTEETNRILQEVTIPRFELHQATLDEALDRLTTTVRAEGISERRFRIRREIEEDLRPRMDWIELRAELQADGSEKLVEKVVDGFLSPPLSTPVIPGLEPIPGVEPQPPSDPSAPHDHRASVTLYDIPLIEVLKQVTSLGNLRYRVEGPEVRLSTRGGETTRTFSRASAQRASRFHGPKAGEENRRATIPPISRHSFLQRQHGLLFARKEYTRDSSARGSGRSRGYTRRAVLWRVYLAANPAEPHPRVALWGALARTG